MQLFAHMRSIKARPVIINDDIMQLRNGLAGDATVLVSNIEKIELTNKMIPGTSVVKLALTKTLEDHNIAVYLKQPIQVTRFFGIQKNASTILFFVEQPAAFLNAVNNKMNNNNG
jgi:hypothetical protein